MFCVDDKFGYYLSTNSVGEATQVQLGVMSLYIDMVVRTEMQDILDVLRPPMGHALRAMTEIAIVVAGERTVEVVGVDPEWQERWDATPAYS